jgi:hypothetical protein
VASHKFFNLACLFSRTTPQDIFMPRTNQIFISASAVVAIAAIAGYSHSGNAQLSGSTSLPLTTQAETSPNLPFLVAKNRSLPSGTVLVPPSTKGGGAFKVINGTNQDAFIKLVNPNSPTLVAAFYVASGSNFTLQQVPDGTYQVLFVLGTNWNSKTQSFTKNKRFARFDKSLNFTTIQADNRIRYKAYQITLNPVVGGNATTNRVNEQEFRRYQ